ncbi:MAG: hypothetical protein AAF828_08270 [Bacteroidota bacterium]
MAKMKDAYATSGADERFVDVLMKALERKNLDGFDYLEFKQSLAALGKMDIDGDTAIKSAFATGSTMGLTVDKLLKSAAYYQQVLLDEKSQFEASMQRHFTQRVEGKREETGRLTKQIAEWQSKIDQLNQKIAKAQTTIEKADAQIAAAKQKAQDNQTSFEATLKLVSGAIDQDMENIKRILG